MAATYEVTDIESSTTAGGGERGIGRPNSFVPITAPHIGEAEREAASRVLLSGHLAQGLEVAEFENEFAEVVDGRQCVAVNSGTSALLLALLAAGVRRGDEVIVPSFSVAATANAVSLAGATPVFADIRPDDWCLDPDSAAATVTSRTAAIVPVHLYGQPARMRELRAVADRYGLLLIEDAAQAHAARDEDGRLAGAIGDAAAFSFYATKNMTTGEGGMVVARDADVARRARMLRDHGEQERYNSAIVGYSMAMTDMAAAIGRAQLRSLPAWNERRRANAAVLTEALRGVPGVKPPVVRTGVHHVFHLYTVDCDDRDRIRTLLSTDGIETGIYYPVPVHRQPAFQAAADLPQTDRAAARVLSLPVHPAVQRNDLERIAAVVQHAAQSGPAY